jgi:hypothetical protein
VAREEITMDMQAEIDRRAKELMAKEGNPSGREAEFRERAKLMLEAERKPEAKTPLGERSAAEAEVDTAMAETFPASDPPAFTATKGPV